MAAHVSVMPRRSSAADSATQRRARDPGRGRRVTRIAPGDRPRAAAERLASRDRHATREPARSSRRCAGTLIACSGEGVGRLVAHHGGRPGPRGVVRPASGRPSYGVSRRMTHQPGQVGRAVATVSSRRCASEGRPSPVASAGPSGSARHAAGATSRAASLGRRNGRGGRAQLRAVSRAPSSTSRACGVARGRQPQLSQRCRGVHASIAATARRDAGAR